MNPSERVRRHGYHLMSLASIGQFVMFFVWIVALVFGWIVQSGTPAGSQPVPTEYWLFACWTSVALLSQLWALGRLRTIGKLLYVDQLISSQMVIAWRRFAAALMVVGLLTLISLRPGNELAGAGTTMGLRFMGVQIGNVTAGDIRIHLDLTQTYFILVACLISYSIAWILDEAVALKIDNQGIV